MGKKNELVVSQYRDVDIFFMEDGWFNATEAAAVFGKRPIDWLRISETIQYVETLCKFHKVSEAHFVKTRRGTKSPGTWFHPKLAVAFARWLSPEFAVWCDMQIDSILRGDHPQFEWKRLRSVAACSFKTMCKLLKLTRDKRGKSTDARHYMNEAKLINWTLTGKYTGLDREKLTVRQLDVLGELETLNGVLIGHGVEYAERKTELVNYMATHLEAKQLFAFETKQIVQ